MSVVMTSKIKSWRQLTPMARQWLTVTFTAAALGFMSAGASAQSCGASASGNTCGGSGVATQGNNSGTPQGAGNPIHLITGNKFVTEVDMAPLPGVLGLELVRHYNSSLSGPQTPTTSIGRGWRWSYDTELAVLGNTVQILQADGTRIGFTRDAADASHCSSPDPQQGRLTARRTQQGEAFDWRWTDGRTLSFDTRGKLVQIRTASGEFVVIQRDARGHLVKVTDPQDRSLVFHYPGAREHQGFRGVSQVDTPVGRFTLHYGTPPLPHSSEPASSLLANLVAVVRPDVPGHSIERRYHHEDPRFPTLLTGISVKGRDGFGGLMDQRVSTYAYGADGRGVISQLGGDDQPIERVVLDRTQPGKTVVVNSRGERTTFRHGLVAGQWRLHESRGPGCARCGPTNLRYAYDPLGRLSQATSLDEQGQPVRSLVTRRDELGRVIEERVVEHRLGDAGRWVVRMDYEGQAFQPSAIHRPSVVAGQQHTQRFTRNELGQVTSVTQQGLSPLDDAGHLLPTSLDGTVPSPHAARAVRIERVTRYEYQALQGRSVLVSVNGPLPDEPETAGADITQLKWDARGHRVVALHKPGGRNAAMRHDDAGRIAQVTDEQGRSTRWERNAAGDTVSLTRQAASDLPVRGRRTQFDALGQPVEHHQGWIDEKGVWHTQADANTWRAGYDLAGEVRWLATATGQLQRWQRDGEGQLIAWSSEAAGQRQAWRQGGESSLLPATLAPTAAHGTAGTDRGAPRLRAVRDDFGRVVARLSADHGDTVYQYDAADRLIAQRDALGQTARHEWTVDGRIRRQVISAPGRADVETRWTVDSPQTLTVHHPHQTETLTHDAEGRIVMRRVQLRDAQRALPVAVDHFRYDAFGQLAEQTLADGSALVWQRNAQGQVVGLKRELAATPWLRSVWHGQVLAGGIERDAVDVSRVVMGHGMEARWVRSDDGRLARIVHRVVPEAMSGVARGFTPSWQLGLRGVMPLLGVSDARAANAPTSQAASSASTVGALGLPIDPAALVDERYGWSWGGNLVSLERRSAHASLAESQGDWQYLYDADDQLLQAQRLAPSSGRSLGWERFAYAAHGQRIGVQQGVAEGNAAALQRVGHSTSSHRTDSSSRYDATGQVLQHSERQLTWSPTGHLEQVTQGQTRLAAYTHNHRGERIAREVSGVRSWVLHHERRRHAELDEAGHVRRLWVHLGDLPLAVIDPTGSTRLASAETTAGLLWQDLRRLAAHAVRSISRPADDQHTERTTWLHTNHLGAPVAATAADRSVRWQAEYTAFGRATVKAEPGFALDLRLPGQHEDAETGLHHNDHRMYDPDAGRYLSPDPLGTPDGPNPYLYVRNNPLRYVDPSGLILFAFDGTNNAPNSRTNVRHFAEAYDDLSDYDLAQGYTGMSFYMPGVGTGMDEGIQDSALATSLRRRVDTQRDRFSGYVQSAWAWHVDRAQGRPAGRLRITLDVVGFSRGAAAAREFANLVADLKRDRFTQELPCLSILQRLMALFDTVLSMNMSALSNEPMRMAIPAEVSFVFHAVAMNEGRRSFGVESIHGSAAELQQSHDSPTRVERGFVGAHANTGGGYDTEPGRGADHRSDLSNVALQWMVQQARRAGVEMLALSPALNQVSNPIVIDERRNLLWTGMGQRWGSRHVYFQALTTSEPAALPPLGDPESDSGRGVGPSPRANQSEVTFASGMNSERATQFITAQTPAWYRISDTATGRVRMCDYLVWLRDNYGMTVDLAAHGCER